MYRFDVFPSDLLLILVQICLHGNRLCPGLPPWWDADCLSLPKHRMTMLCYSGNSRGPPETAEPSE